MVGRRLGIRWGVDQRVASLQCLRYRSGTFGSTRAGLGRALSCVLMDDITDDVADQESAEQAMWGRISHKRMAVQVVLALLLVSPVTVAAQVETPPLPDPCPAPCRARSVGFSIPTPAGFEAVQNPPIGRIRVFREQGIVAPIVLVEVSVGDAEVIVGRYSGPHTAEAACVEYAAFPNALAGVERLERLAGSGCRVRLMTEGQVSRYDTYIFLERSTDPDSLKIRAVVWCVGMGRAIDDVCDEVVEGFEAEDVFAEDAVDEPPSTVSCPPVEYPALLRQANIEGEVLLEFVIETDGRVQSALIHAVTASSATDVAAQMFVEQAKSMVAECRFLPGRVDGRPVRVLALMPVSFKLQPNPGDQPEG